MPRQKINVPEQWAFSTSIPVRITDVNYGRHVGNDTMLSLLQEARVQWLRSLGYPSELLVEPVGLILIDIGIRFKAELVYGDVATVQIAVTEVSKRGFELTYLVTKGDDRAEVARATTGFVFFDYSSRRLAEPPAGFFAKAGAPVG